MAKPPPDASAAGDQAPPRAYGVLQAPRGDLVAGQIVFVDGALPDDIPPATDAQVAAAGHFLFPLPPA